MEKTELEWFDNPNFISNLLIGIILVIVIISQGFAIRNNWSVNELLGSIMNHNSIYLLILAYFVALKTKSGKRLFNFLNIGVIVVYFIAFVAAFLSIFQSFGIIPLFNVVILGILTIYLLHSLLKNTRWWKELGVVHSPFNEVSNDWYFLTVLSLTIVCLLVTLIEAVSLDGIVLALFDAVYLLLFVRFIYLYNEFLNNKELKNKNKQENAKKVKSSDK